MIVFYFYRMGTFAWSFIFCLTFYSSFAVDRNNFKTCDQSGFCKRLRAFSPNISPYDLNTESVRVVNNVLTADVFAVNPEVGAEKDKCKYILKLSALVDGTYRVELDEATPLYPRYRTQLALDGEPSPDSMKLLENKKGKITVVNSRGEKVVLTAEPLKIEFLDKSGNVAVVLNEKALLNVEHLRKKREKVADHEEENAVIQQEEEDGMWGENFKSHHDSKLRGNEAISLDFSFPDADNVYGIPEHTDKFALRTTTSGEPYRLFNLDVFEYELDSNMAIYGAIPVLYAHGSERTVGVFWHNSAETWVDVQNYNDGTVVSSLVDFVTGNSKQKRVDARFMSESGILDVFVLLGDKPADVFRQYTKLTGVAPLPPKFSLAYHQCRWNYNDQEDIRQLDENFDQHDIAADVYWLDIEYTDRKKYFTWDLEKFPHPAEMISNVTAKGRKMVVIIDPHIKREAGYFLHEDATENNYYVKNKDGNDYEGWCWPGSSSYLDFFNPIVSKYYSDRYKYENFPGTSKDVHIWNDMNEPSVFNGPEVTMPKDCRHYKPHVEGEDGLSSFWEHRHVHNEYGLAHIKGTFEGMLNRADGKYRPFILTRSAFAGTQRYAAVWTGDNAAEWGFLAVSVPMCLSLASAGISFCGSDVGGFFKYPEAELMARWYQAGAFQSFFRAHSHIETKRREPWLYDSSTTALIREAIRRRYIWLDFWYTKFYEHTLNGLPVTRALWQDYPDDKETYTMDNQYTIANELLVRPVVEKGVTSVKVYLPGKDSNTIWYDADSYVAHVANGYINQAVTMAKIPVYHRGGTIVQRKERVRRSSVLMHDDPYTLVIALDADNKAEGTIYIDDGETYEYKKRKYIYAKITCDENVISYDFIDDNSSYPTRSWVERIIIPGTKRPPTSGMIIQDEKSAPLDMILHKGNNVLVIRKPAAKMSRHWKIMFKY